MFNGSNTAAMMFGAFAGMSANSKPSKPATKKGDSLLAKSDSKRGASVSSDKEYSGAIEAMGGEGSSDFLA